MGTLNLKQAAALLKIHPVTLQEKAKAGEIPGAKVGRAWVFI
jgi:excisionase family DNA binding protein